MMKSNFKSTAIGFAAGLAIATVAAQAAQHDQHSPVAPQQQPAQKGSMDHSQMMANPAMRQQMMERMRQCRETMSHMMERMGQMHEERRRP